MEKLPRGQEPKETQGNPHQNSLLKTKWQVHLRAIQEWGILGDKMEGLLDTPIFEGRRPAPSLPPSPPISKKI